MSKFQNFPVEFAEIKYGVVKEALRKLISGMGENQRQHPELYAGEIERELQWVDVSRFKSTEITWATVEERWLHLVATDVESSANGIPGKTYVIPLTASVDPGEEAYYDGIPRDVLFIQVNENENGNDGAAAAMDSLRAEHLRAQCFYREELARPPHIRRRRFRLVIQRAISRLLSQD